MAAAPKLDASTEATMKQFREFLASYNKVTEMCFNDCIHDFTTRKVPKEEETCSNHCLDKYLKMTQRISQRFQEIQMEQNDSILNKQNQAAGGIFG